MKLHPLLIRVWHFNWLVGKFRIRSVLRLCSVLRLPVRPSLPPVRTLLWYCTPTKRFPLFCLLGHFWGIPPTCQLLLLLKFVVGKLFQLGIKTGYNIRQLQEDSRNNEQNRSSRIIQFGVLSPAIVVQLFSPLV